jgi:uncharacterized protein with von Willebrand factor type A (vWA) domain
MFSHFFHEMKKVGIPVSLREYLTLFEALDAKVPRHHIDDFYYLSRATFVKDERNLDKFDRVFASVFKGIESLSDIEVAEIPEDWLQALSEKFLTEEEKAEIEKMGGWDKLMETLKKRLEEQKKRHEGGNKMIGTGGTSPYGAEGYNPEGVRIGQKESRHKKAVKVWDKRNFKNLDDSVELGTRNVKMALRKLRHFARDGAPEVLDLDDTIRKTAQQGYLDLALIPERRNMIKVLLFFDVGGSMDPHIKMCEELFSAARTEFKHMEYFYFHNCLYESVWKNNRRRHNEQLDVWDILHRFSADYKIIFVGDASMSPYELTYPGGSVEHWNEEAGALWLERVTSLYQSCIWLNPVPEQNWEFMPSLQMIEQIFNDRMFPLTLEGIDRAMAELRRG